MTKIHGNTYLYFTDRKVENVSGIWKALHISIYLAIAIMAFIASMAAGNMFQTFKYNCILFCNGIQFERDKIQDFNTTLQYSNYSNGNNIIFANSSHVFELAEDGAVDLITAKIDLKKSSFPKRFWCDFVLGTALVTFIFVTFFAVILAMCSKGGRGLENTLNRPQNIMYPVLLSSLIFVIINLLAAITVDNGMKPFCANFKQFNNNNESCSSIINQFTLHDRQNNFYSPYRVFGASFKITAALFGAQLVVTMLRVLYAVDYQLYTLEFDAD